MESFSLAWVIIHLFLLQSVRGTSPEVRMSNEVSSYSATCYIQLGVKTSLSAHAIPSCEECFIVKDDNSTYESPFKVPTCILTEISPDGGHTFLEFGFIALRNYHQCRPDTKNKICLFQDFVIPTETQVTQ